MPAEPPPPPHRKTASAAHPRGRGWSIRRAEHGIVSLLLQPLDAGQIRQAVIERVCSITGWAGGICWDLPAALQSTGCRPAAVAAGWAPSPGLRRHGATAGHVTRFLAARAAGGPGPDALQLVAGADAAFLAARLSPQPGGEPLQAGGIHWTIALPLQGGGQPAGVIEFFSAETVLDPLPLQQFLPPVARMIAQLLQRHRAESEHARFRAALDLSADEIYLIDRATMRFVDCNATACTSYGITRQTLLELPPHELWRVDPAALERSLDEGIQAGPPGIVTRSRRHAEHGRAAGVVEVHHAPLRRGDRWLLLTTARDITERVRADKTVQRLGRMLAALSATNEAIMRAASPETLYQQVCEAAVDGGKFLTAAILLPDPQSAAMTIVAVAGPHEQRLRQVRISVDASTPIGRGLVGTAFHSQTPCVSNTFLSDERTRPWHEQARQAGIASGAAMPLVRNGSTLGVLLFYSQQKHEFDDEVVRLLERMAANVVFALDNMEHEAERQRSRARIDYLASHDGLTGLPNRAMFSEVLNLSIATARRYQRKFAVMFLDLDRFKLINDSLGHEAGDQLLKEMSIRLTGCLRDSDVVARLGGDEFVVLVQELADPEQVAIVARKILAAAMKPFTLLGQECRVTASVGISMYPADAEDEPALMKNADLAMYFAKEEGKNNYQFYSRDIASQSLERLALETNLRRALERNEFTLHYQAKVDLKTGKINGVEALLRWHSAELGHVSPAQLIPVAEETGLIVSIGKWVLKTACVQNMAWQQQGLPPVCMAVNLSARQFSDPFLLQDIGQVLQDTGMDPQLLELEITEGMVIQHPEKAIKVLAAIKALGVRLAIDDFGTGYSSLGQLKHFPIDTLKVDRSFIRDIPDDSEDRAIAEAIIAMGKTLNLTVVAEGVETAAQETFLRQHACDEMQGYLISKPVAAQQFADLLRANSAPAGPGLPPAPQPAQLSHVR
jgi:diguanylate cyclase (GGDEF)-like protein/PAS domain S-box-containing protein